VPDDTGGGVFDRDPGNARRTGGCGQSAVPVVIVLVGRTRLVLEFRQP
jgi:hypothetical protein